jgi:hypothetical protein
VGGLLECTYIEAHIAVGDDKKLMVGINEAWR